MYRLLAHVKENRTGVVLMQDFESAMEAHLEVLRREVAGLQGDVRSAEAAHDRCMDECRDLKAQLASSSEFARVLKAQVQELLSENGKLKADRARYKQWMRSAVRQNKRERENVKAYRATQEEHVAEIQRLSSYLDRQEGVSDSAGGSISSNDVPTYWEKNHAAQAALQEVKP